MRSFKRSLPPRKEEKNVLQSEVVALTHKEEVLLLQKDEYLQRLERLRILH
ncbi:43975_t:CDS:2 [Gigaspora margarita]|uniref:43975_t:CDS:1 n=1 Tax=Gigaspora margarita TaxID=4874 RepID=A0ABN7UAD4_GIGMA|nr:43975_t:CDS:2 [Gigaspora margarita]